MELRGRMVWFAITANHTMRPLSACYSRAGARRAHDRRDHHRFVRGCGAVSRLPPSATAVLYARLYRTAARLRRARAPGRYLAGPPLDAAAVLLAAKRAAAAHATDQPAVHEGLPKAATRHVRHRAGGARGRHRVVGRGA